MRRSTQRVSVEWRAADPGPFHTRSS